MRKSSLLIALTLFLIPAVRAVGGAEDFVIGIVTNDAREFARARVVAAGNELKAVDLRASQQLGKDAPSCGAILVTARFLGKETVGALRNFVAQGGILIVMGRAGEYEDSDGNGKRSPGDRRVWAFSKLCGVQRIGGHGRFRTVRAWGRHPLFLDLPPGKPISLSGSSSLGTIASCQGATPIASGFNAPVSHGTADDLPKLGWYAASRTVGESVYVSVRRYEKGTAVYVADDLMSETPAPAQQALLKRLLSPLVTGVGRAAPPPMPLLANARGNLVYNGDMENVCAVTTAYGKNGARPPFPFPLGWQYNNWGGGKYKIIAAEHDRGGWYYTTEYTGEPGVAANSACVLRCRHFSFHPRLGRTYRLSCRMRSTRPVRMRIWGKHVSGKAWSHPVGTVEATEDWSGHGLELKLSPNVFAGETPHPGFYLDFTIQGGGRLDLDDVSLKELPEG